MSESDAALLGRSANGDATAFERFVDRHQASVFSLLDHLARDRADAEDAFQEAFASAWGAAGSFRGGESARAWILTIARHALSRQRRRRAGEPAAYEPLDSLETLGLRAGWGAVVRPDALLDRLADRELVERALASLPAEEREVVLLRDVEQLPGGEVAEMIGLSLAAMKSRLHRGRLRLAAAIREEVS